MSDNKDIVLMDMRDRLKLIIEQARYYAEHQKELEVKIIALKELIAEMEQ